ncbi:MAG: hypothetical protein JJU19_09810 [Pararhodobacter sp.]|nr:hypothetical protein [Pararhodobacter sp.]
MDALFIAELNERLFTHFTGGHWRVPLSGRHLPVHRASGARFGQIICAEPPDVARALDDLTRAGTPAGAEAMYQTLDALATSLDSLRRDEGFDDTAPPPMPTGAVPALPGTGPVVLMTAAQVSPRQIGRVLIGCAGRGVIWKPAPRAAASAHLLMRHLGPMAAGRLALLQGDHATGGTLGGAVAGAGALVWISPAPPPDGLQPPVAWLTQALRPVARSPGRP